MKNYFIPGLGTDERLFQFQKRDGLEFEVLNWIPPVGRESIEEYAKRFSEFIAEKPGHFNLLGVSLGGMIAVEISKYKEPANLILVSSVKNEQEMPGWIKAFRYFPLQKLIPGYWYKNIGVWFIKRFGNLALPGSKHFLRMLQDAHPEFISWALQRVIYWKNQHCPDHPVHIHGKKDNIFPIGRIEKPIVIENAGHTLIMANATALNQYLKQLLPKHHAS